MDVILLVIALGLSSIISSGPMDMGESQRSVYITLPSNVNKFIFNFSYKFGIIQVDFNDPERKRTPKLSSKFLRDVIKQNAIPNVDYSL